MTWKDYHKKKKLVVKPTVADMLHTNWKNKSALTKLVQT